MVKTIIAAMLGGLVAAIFVVLWDEGRKVSGVSDFTADPQLVATHVQMQKRISDLEAMLVTILSAEENTVRSTTVADEDADTAVVVPHKENLVHPSAQLVQQGYRRVSIDSLQQAGLDGYEARLTAQLVNQAFDEQADALKEYAKLRGATKESVRELLETQIGEHGFDSYLYATGQRNRVQVLSVLEGSTAEESGLLAKDVIHSINGRKVFAVGDISRVQSPNHSLDEFIELVVLRGQVQHSTYLQRGQLGMRFANIRINPAAE